jgi:uncharacterized metal-binding protein
MILALEAGMVDLPKKKVGIVACSGEELAEGTVTRLAALMVLERLRPNDTVTICLPLFLAGGEGDRAFARFYPTIAVDGCEQRCAARATELYSGKPAASLVVSELVAEKGLERPQGCRHLDQAGLQAVDITAVRMAELVDELLDKRWNRRAGEFIQEETTAEPEETKQATCSCGSGIPLQEIEVAGEKVTLMALPLIFAKMQADGKAATSENAQELLETVCVYNPIPNGAEDVYKAALLHEYQTFCQGKEVPA